MNTKPDAVAFFGEFDFGPWLCLGIVVDTRTTLNDERLWPIQGIVEIRITRIVFLPFLAYVVREIHEWRYDGRLRYTTPKEEAKDPD